MSSNTTELEKLLKLAEKGRKQLDLDMAAFNASTDAMIKNVPPEHRASLEKVKAIMSKGIGHANKGNHEKADQAYREIVDLAEKIKNES